MGLRITGNQADQRRGVALETVFERPPGTGVIGKGNLGNFVQFVWQLALMSGAMHPQGFNRLQYGESALQLGLC